MNNTVSNKQKLQVEYLISQAKNLILYFRNKNKRWTEKIKLEIDKVINIRSSLIEMNNLILNENINKSIQNLDKYLIDLEYIKKYDRDIGKPNGYKSYKDFNIIGKKKELSLSSDYNFQNDNNHYMFLTTSVEYKNKISKLEIIGLLREILLRLSIEEKYVDERINFAFKKINKKFENIKFKIIYVNDFFLSIPLEDLKTELDYSIYIATKKLLGPNSKPRENINIYNNIQDFEELENLLFKHQPTNKEYIFTPTIKDYYDKLS